MALTTKQRNRLPDSAFAYPSQRKYPIPTKAQARKAGISEAQRQRTLNNAKSRAAQRQTSGSYGHVAAKVSARGGSKATRGRR
jgi:hypothetical protein